MLKARYAIMIDGGFATKILNSRKRAAGDATFTSADDIESECARLQNLAWVADYELLRIYYYDAPPLSGNVARPVTGANWALGASERHRHAQSLYDKLKLKPNMALRLGETYLGENRWILKGDARKSLVKSGRTLEDGDFELNVEQKGVDMRIGMDIARLALREMVRCIIVVTADRDFIPAFKFARREGVRIVLDPLGANAPVELKEHADIVV
ncbi:MULTISPECIES: NYN domain-containing protein [Azospirillum]|nr:MULTISPECIES: NYN domain-containing protein [Azospirillum]